MSDLTNHKSSHYKYVQRTKRNNDYSKGRYEQTPYQIDNINKRDLKN